MNYPKTVLEIHNEFNSASERLLQQAIEVINNSGVNADKIARLEKAGFKNSVEVRKYQQIKVTSEQARLIQYYQQKYPLNKFITEEQVEAICKKYKLECAPVDRYKGFVPEGKLKQIEDFYLRCEDQPEPLAKKLEFTLPNTQHKDIRQLRKDYPSGIYPLSNNMIFTKSGTHIWVDRYDAINNNERLICAPKKDFDLTGLSKIGAMFLSVTTVHVPDPVVLQPVKGGYLILAAWGDEASDELVLNPKHN